MPGLLSMQANKTLHEDEGLIYSHKSIILTIQCPENMFIIHVLIFLCHENSFVLPTEC